MGSLWIDSVMYMLIGPRDPGHEDIDNMRLCHEDTVRIIAGNRIFDSSYCCTTICRRIPEFGIFPITTIVWGRIRIRTLPSWDVYVAKDQKTLASFMFSQRKLECQKFHFYFCWSSTAAISRIPHSHLPSCFKISSFAFQCNLPKLPNHVSFS